MFVKLFFQILSKFGSVVLYLFSMSEGEEIGFVIKELLSFPIKFFFLINAVLGVILNKLIAFAHKQLIFASFITSNLIFYTF